MNDPEMEAPPSFWVRALYDYHSTDDSALSFSRGDIVEVLTQLESGWWDGLIGTERGWFPSNFVVVISDQEAETELGPRDQEEPGAIGVDPATLDASDSEWVQDELEQAVDLDLGGLQGDDLWLPEVQPNGQIVYVNGAGQRRTELPDTEDMSPPPPVTRPRANTATTQSSLGGFAFVRRTGTPEPWLKRLTDDGHTFYYENPDTGEIVWSRPEPNRGPSTQQSLASSASGLDLRTRFRAAEPEEELTTEDESEPPNRMSVYSDASEVNPRFDDAPTDLPPDTEPRTDPVEVQRRLAPPDPEPIDALAAVARQAIDAVSQCMQSEDRAPHAPLVAQVILAVRNLLYVSGTLAPSPATIASLALTPDQTPTEPPQGAVAELKQFQRKVTATLSKLVLSARAADSGEDDANARSRVVIDAGELERAVDRFVNEAAERGLTSSNSEGAKHRGVLDTSHIGRGLPGAGIGGRWRGSGFVEPTAKPLTVEVCGDLKRMGAELEQALGGVEEGVKAVRTGDAEDTSTIVGGGDETDGVSTIITRGRTAITALCALLNAAEELDVATKVGRDIEAKRGFVRKSVLEDGIRRVGSRDQLGRIGSRDQLGLNHKASRDKLSRPASRDKLSRMGSRDELGPHALGMSRQASRDQLSRPGSRDKLSRPASRDKLSRQASRDRLSRPGSSHRSPGTPGMRLPTSISPRMPNAENGIDTLRQDTQSTVRPKPSNTLRAETGLKLDTSQDVRLAVRRLEVSKQALYDAGVTLLLASQTVHVVVLRSAGTAPAPTKDDEETTTTGIDANALNLVSSSITSIRLNSREMLNLFDALARTDPAESYVPASSPVPTPGPASGGYRRPSRADIYPPRGPPTRSRADTYSRADTFRTDSFTHAESPYVTSPVDDHLAMMYGGGDMWGDMIYGIDSAPRERVESTTLPRERFDSITRDRMDSVSRDRLDSITRDRVDSVSRDRVDSVTRDTRLDSTESARGTYGRTYPERGIYADAERGRRDDRFYADKRGVGVGGDKPRAPLKHLDSAVSLPQSDVSADSAPGQYSRTGTALGKGRPDDELDFSGEEEDDSRSPPRVHKLTKILGREAEAVIKGGVTPAPIIDTTPWYLKPTYNDPSQILNNTDGGVRGGTLPALVERLTMHDQLDATFIDSFLMTYKSFTTTKELFQLLVERFRIQPPEGLTPQELEEWTDKKQKPLRVRVVNIFRKMLLDPSVIDKEDGYILDHIKAFASEIVNDVPPAKQLIVFVDRILFQGQGDTLGRKYTATIQPNAPPSILPKGGKRLKLLDIEPLELARQLTLLESKQYNAIKPIECLARARDEPAENDSIKTIITTTNKIASWVAFSVLDKEDARRRGNIIRHFISVAEKCRALHNYSSMAALIAGLNSPPIRRLKRTWDAVPAKSTAILDEVEATLDSGKNFTAYKQRLKTVDSACVPFLGVYLTVLTFIQDGNKDFISKENGIINFGKRQKTAEVIREIQSYQAKQYNLSVVDQVQAFIEQSLASVDEKADYWDKSLSMEPREREDEKMTRMLQESGFL